MTQISRQLLDNKKAIAQWLDEREVVHYEIDNDLSVRVYGEVDLCASTLHSLGHSFLSYIPFQFLEVQGDFNCSNNHLTTLEGSPYTVKGSALFSYNQIYCLQGVPLEVHKTLDLSSNRLTSLEGIPTEILGGLNIASNRIQSLQFSPQWIGQEFNFSYNPIEDFEFLPQVVGGYIDCIETNIRSLDSLNHKLTPGTDFFCNGVIEVIEFLHRPLKDMSYTRIKSNDINAIYEALSDKKRLTQQLPYQHILYQNRNFKI